MKQVSDLLLIFTPPQAGPSSEAMAVIEVRYEALQLTFSGNVLTDPMTAEERRDMRWYLEDYWKWPYEQFLERGRYVEALLPIWGRRLFEAAFGNPEAKSIIQAWRKQPGTHYQISIVSTLPNVLSLPWELLHDEQGFMALGGDTYSSSPAVVVRRLSPHERAETSTSLLSPLRILLVTARPEETGFIDPRSIARELIEEIEQQGEASNIEVEFLRPPTLRELSTRLNDLEQPVHVLHFDGHGSFDREQEKQGLLAFENEGGGLHWVRADELGQVLRGKGVRLVVLNACQSAVGSVDDALSSIATQLLQCDDGVDAVVAMSASILASTAARYVEAFYRALAAGVSAQMAHERAQYTLYYDPLRHPHRRRLGEMGTPVKMQDWWVPNFYQQQALILQPTGSKARREEVNSRLFPRLSKDMPDTPRYGFTGRARELLQIERALNRRRLVMISGFGGEGKTALAREAADWLTRTKMFDGACFVSFEHYGDATILLKKLGEYLGVDNDSYNPNDLIAALDLLEPILKKRHILLVVDDLESILPGGTASLDEEARTEVYDVLLELKKTKVSILLTSRGTVLGDRRLTAGNEVMRLILGGLDREDAHVLASRLLEKKKIDRARIPYADLSGLLDQLGHNPLAIQLVLPILQKYDINTIRTYFTSLFPEFVDEAETGRNRSLEDSLDYSLKRLSPTHRPMLDCLVYFAEGANEDILLKITEIAQPVWDSLRLALQEAALLRPEKIHEYVSVPFLRFHPALISFLRRGYGLNNMALRDRYIECYYAFANFLDNEDARNPLPVRALAQYEFANLLQTLELLLDTERWIEASELTNGLVSLLNTFGLYRKSSELRERVVRRTPQ